MYNSEKDGIMATDSCKLIIKYPVAAQDVMCIFNKYDTSLIDIREELWYNIICRRFETCFYFTTNPWDQNIFMLLWRNRQTQGT